MFGEGIAWYGEYTIASVGEFLSNLPEQAGELPWGYRGQADRRWKLTPSLYRERYDALQPPIDDRKSGYEMLEKWLLNRFKAYALPHVASTPDFDISWLALAQHYGLPTRLLDWTESPLIALFFALREDEGEDAVVWAILVKEEVREREDSLSRRLGPASIPIFRYHPSHTTPRITAQQGFFTVQNIESFSDRGMELGRWMPLETQFGLNLAQVPVEMPPPPPGPWFRKYTIPRQHRVKILGELDVLGINHYTVFPDLEGVAKKLRQDVQMRKWF